MRRIILLIVIALIVTPSLTFLDINHTAVYGVTADSQPDGMRTISADWPMFGHDGRHSFRAVDSPMGITVPAKKWDVGQIDSLCAPVGNFMPAVSGTLSTRSFVVYSAGSYIRLADGKTGETAWELNADSLNDTPGERIYSGPAVMDLNGNSMPDIVFATNSGWVHAFEPRMTYSAGSYSWPTDVNITQKLWSVHLPASFTESSLTYANLGNSSTDDIIVAGATDTGISIYALDGDTGNKLWEFDAIGERTSTPAVYPWTETKNRIIINTLSTQGFTSVMHTYMITGDGIKAWDHTFNVSTSMPQRVSLLPSPSIVELDGNTADGMEIVVPVPFEDGKGIIHVLKRDGTQLWKTGANDVVGQFDASAGYEDINSDGTSDIIAVSWGMSGLNPITHVYAFDGRSGSKIWEKTIDSTATNFAFEYALASPALVDLNKDGTGDVVVVTSPSVYALDGTDGTLLWNLTMQSSYNMIGSPTATDMDGDGFMDIFAGGVCLSHNIVDLEISSSDISVIPETPVEDSDSTVAAIVHNTGHGHGSDIKVRFMDGNKLIGDRMLDSIDGQDSAEVSITWTPENAGVHTIKVILDPDNNIDEPNEDNNEAAISVNVTPRYVNLFPSSIKFFRADDVEADGDTIHPIAGKVTTIEVMVNNSGNKDSGTVVVSISDNGAPVGSLQSTPNIPAGGYSTVSVQWTGTEGNHQITVDVDPDNSINESDETDNTLSRSIYVKSADPGTASYVIQGLVFLPDGQTLAPAIPISISNQRTGNSLNVVTGDNGDYYADIKDMPGGYAEEDTVVVIVDTDNYHFQDSILVYSEDGGTIENIVLQEKANHSFTLSVSPKSISAKPGEDAYFTVELQNTGNTASNITVSVVDVPTTWNTTLSPAGGIVTVPMGGSAQVQITITVPSGSSAGLKIYPHIKARSEDTVHDDTVTLEVSAVPGISLSITDDNPSIDVYGSANHTSEKVTLTNTGNTKDTLRLSVDTPSGSSAELTYTNGTKATVVELLPSNSMELTLNIWATGDVATVGKTSFSVQVHAVSKIYSDNNATSGITVGILYPDLTIKSDSYSIVPSQPVVGAAATVTFTVVNQGKGSAPESRSQLIWMKLQGSEYIKLVLGSADIEPLAPGSEKTVSIPWVVSDGGAYTIRACVDNDLAVVESNENNNYIEHEYVLLPDLGFESTPSVQVSYSGSKVNLKLTADISNSGTSDYDGNAELAVYYISQDSTARVKIASKEIRKLGVGGSTEIVIDADNLELTGGQYTAIFVIDDGNVTGESNEDNNEGEVDFVVRATSSTSSGTTSSNSETSTTTLAAVVAVLGILLYFIWVIHNKKESRGMKGKERRQWSEGDEDEEDDDEEEEVYVAEVVEEGPRPQKRRIKKKRKK